MPGDLTDITPASEAFGQGGRLVNEYMCDVCSRALPRPQIKFHSAGAIRNAIRDGFDPWTTPRIIMPGALREDPPSEPDPRRYQDWRDMAMTDTSEWGLCPACTNAISEVRAQSQG